MSNKEERQEMIDYINSLSDEQFHELVARFRSMKTADKPTTPKPTISTREPSLPFQRKSETSTPFQKIKR